MPSVISKTTSSGLVKLLANNKKGIILSPEVFDILNKLMRSDEDNATGDVQLLCKLYSGDRCCYNYSTEETRVIAHNTPFCILGSTQLVNAAKLIAKMDQGHGLIDRILIATPLIFRPTLTEMEAVKGFLTTEVVNDFEEYFNTIHGLSEQQVQFSFCDDAKQALHGTMDQFVADVNEAIQDGRVPPKSKIPELIPRVATALHVSKHSMVELLAGHTPTEPPRPITRSTLESATIFVRHLESQKEILSG